MLRFSSRFQADFRLKSGRIEPLRVGGHAPFSPCEAVHINPEGYDLGLRDIYDERVYSNSRAVVLYEDRIFPADPYTIPLGHDEEMMRSGWIIVTGNMLRSGYRKILNNMYSIEYEELVSIIGEEQAEMFLGNPENKLGTP